jgi:hypothetical protein
MLETERACPRAKRGRFSTKLNDISTKIFSWIHMYVTYMNVEFIGQNTYYNPGIMRDTCRYLGVD